MKSRIQLEDLLGSIYYYVHENKKNIKDLGRPSWLIPRRAVALHLPTRETKRRS